MMRHRTLSVSLAALLLLAISTIAAPSALAATFTVNSTDDDEVCTTSHCTLRGAILAANGAPGADSIAFSLPLVAFQQCNAIGICFPVLGTNPIRLTLRQPDGRFRAMPSITQPVTIDGTTQSGFSGRPFVEVRGPGANINTTSGLLRLGFGSDGSTIRGLAITTGVKAIEVFSSNNVIAGNFIGLDVAGTARPNGSGVVIQGNDNLIGGDDAADRNVISGNEDAGITLCECLSIATDITGSRNRIVGNFIGTNVGGTAAVGNQDGVVVARVDASGVSGNLIGGGFTEDRNVISSNRGRGVFISGGSDNIVGSNVIGLNAAASAPVPNGGSGIVASGAARTRIGTVVELRSCTLLGRPGACPTVVSSGNVISGNSGSGVELALTSQMTGVTLVGNAIGTDRNGTASLGNAVHGVMVSGSSNGVNVIGSSALSGANNIAFNAVDGVHVTQFARNVTIRFNHIVGNADQGIDLESNLAVPDIDTVTNTSTSTRIQGTFPGREGDVVLDFYASPACDNSGDRHLVSRSATVGANEAPAAFDVTIARVPNGEFLTATATDEFGTTTEFSPCHSV